MTPPDANLPARPDYIAVTYISASVERVWRAFTNPEDQAAYSGIVLAKEPPNRLLITWGFDADPPPDRVEFLIEPAANGVTRVTIKEYHSRDWPEDITDSAVRGWNALLAGLKTLVETGKPLPPPLLQLGLASMAVGFDKTDPPGDYRFIADVRDKVSGRSLAVAARLKLAP